MTVITAPPREDWGIADVPAVLPQPSPARGSRRRADRDGRIAGLDGLRGAAVLAVLAFHEGWLRGGFIAVDVFFVVSGFVITRLLLPGYRRGGLATFWARRFRRLLPAVLALVAVAQVWVRLGAPASHWRLLNGQTRAALGYASNWYAIVARSGYWEADAIKTPLLHLWSLAVEEQFYLVWPLLVLGALRLGGGTVRRWMAVAAGLMAAASLAATPFVFTMFGSDRAYYGTDTRVGLILVGAAFALVRAMRPAPEDPRRGGWTTLLSVGALVVCACTLATHGRAYYEGGQLVVALASLGLVATVVDGRRSRVSTVLSSAPLVWIGVRSYGMYLWSWPVQVVLTADRTGISGVSLLMTKAAVLLVLTQVSYHLVELPIRRGVLPGWRAAVALVVAVMLVAAGSLVLQPAKPLELRDGVLVSTGHDDTRGLRILVVGDSWARNLGAGLVMADTSRRHTVVNDGVASCGLHNLPTRSGTVEHQVGAECADFEARWRREVRTFEPDAVLLVTGRWDQAATRIDGRFVRPDALRFRARYAVRLDTAISILSSGGAPVYVANVVDNPAPDERRWSDAINVMLADAVSRNPSARLLDVHRMLCPDRRCAARLDGASVYDDTRHLTPEWQRRIGARLLERLHREVAPSGGDARARRRAARTLLPDPATLAGGAPVAVTYPRYPRVVSDLLPGMSLDDRGLTALGAAIAVTGPDGRVVRAIGLRFAGDAVPDRVAVATLERLEADGWDVHVQSGYRHALLVREGAVRVLVRAPSGLAVAESQGGPAGASERAAGLLAIAGRFVDGGR